jgi:molybdopterin molybdotransferase
MLSVEQALSHVMEWAKPLPPRRLRLADALGLRLAEDVQADRDLPPFDKSLVDGYAVRSDDLAGGDRWLKVGEEITAGRMPTRALAPGECAAIMTGAPLPERADAVLMLEDAQRRDDGSVSFPGVTTAPGRNVLARGREMRAGDRLFERGRQLGPVDLGLLASVGRACVEVVPGPEVLILPTGDELVEPDQVPGPGQIRNSNAPMLAALAATYASKAEALPIALDEPGLLRSALELGLAADVLLISGGVSAGKRDLVPCTLEALGVTCVFHKVRVKPGKPLWFGVGPARAAGSGCLVFGLPGNPVSSLVGYLLFVRPALEALRGLTSPSAHGNTKARLAAPFAHRGDRPTYHPSRMVGRFEPGGDGLPQVEPLKWAGSSDLRTVAQADCFALFPAGDRDYAAGEVVSLLRM